MEKEFVILALTAITVGFFHTLLGPDHYVPFAAMAHARRWSNRKTLLITALCGIGHVASSLFLGFIGIAAGMTAAKFKLIENIRGEIASWFLIAFGLTYFVWAFIKKLRTKEHAHEHIHHDSDRHAHVHNHQHGHMHLHSAGKKENLTPWVLFLIFLFGPCEPLIPLVMYPAMRSDWKSVFMVIVLFGSVTLITMLGMVFVSLTGLSALSIRLEKYTRAIAGFSHAIAGVVILFCGVLIKFFGL